MRECILITGGSGLLALNWALAVKNTKYVILTLHNQKITLPGVGICSLNLESSDEIIDELRVLKPSLVIHAAGLTSVEMCEERPNLAAHINIDLANNLAKACTNLELPFVHISTDHLFAGDTAYIDENCPIRPLNVYAKTKALAEHMVLKECPKALVIRTNFYGWGTSYRQSFSDFIINTLRAEKKLELFDDVFYTPILVEALAKATHDLIDLKASGIFNIVGGQRLSKFDFGIKLAKAFGLDEALINATQITKKPLMTKRPLDMSLSNKKAVGFLGRDFGTIDDHLARLCRQEENGMATELGKL